VREGVSEAGLVIVGHLEISHPYGAYVCQRTTEFTGATPGLNYLWQIVGPIEAFFEKIDNAIIFLLRLMGVLVAHNAMHWITETALDGYGEFCAFHLGVPFYALAT
jgi:hypothetical protein